MAEAVRLGRCPRCKGYVLVAEAQGVRLALDVAAADALGFANAVAGGQRLWWVKNGAERPLGVLGTYSAGRQPQWLPGGSQTGAQRLHVEHGCGAPARDMVIMKVDSPKGSAPATPGAAAGGSPHRAAPVAGAQGRGFRSPARSATPRPFKCNVCRQPIIGIEYVAIECGTYSWAMHEECP